MGRIAKLVYCVAPLTGRIAGLVCSSICLSHSGS